MSRPRQSVPSYRHHKPSGHARATVDGRNIRQGKWNSPASREAYARLIADLDANGSVAPLPKAAPISCAALAANYLDYVEANGLYLKNGKTTSERLCLAVALHPLVRLFGVAAQDFGPRAPVRNELCKARPVLRSRRRARRRAACP